MTNRRDRVKAALLATTPLFILGHVASAQAQQISVFNNGDTVLHDMGTISTSGAISAVTINANNATFTNLATLMAEPGSTTPVVRAVFGANVGVFNQGVISAVSDGRSFGVFNDTLFDSVFVNDGEISVSGNNHVGVVFFGGEGNIITNNGDIDVSSGSIGTGIQVDNESAPLVQNTGVISALGSEGAGIFIIDSTDVTIFNSASGIIEAAQDGVLLSTNSAASSPVTITNDGVISGGAFSIRSVSGSDVIINVGTLVGDVDLGATNDGFFNYGTVEGDVNLGADNDIVTVYLGSEITGTLSGGVGSDVIFFESPTLDTNGDISLDGIADFERLFIGVSGNVDFAGNNSWETITLLDSQTSVWNNASLEETFISINLEADLTLGANFEASSTGSFDVVAVSSGSALTNNGILAAGGEGTAAVGGVSVESVTITNNNLLGATGIDGIGVGFIDSADVHVVNNADASIVVAETGSSGVIFDGVIGGSIENSGSILAAGDSFSDGIVLFGVSDVQVTNNEGGVIGAAGELSRGILVAGADNITITNDGSILTTSLGERAFGIVAVDIQNSTITNTGVVQTAGFDSSAINVQLGENVLVVNDGEIRTSGELSDGIRLGDVNQDFFGIDPVSFSSIENSGSVTVSGAFSAGLSVTAGVTNDVYNNGDVTATGENGLGVLILDADDTLIENDVDGSIIASGTGGIGVAFLSGANTANALFNAGYISGTQAAVLGGSGNEIVVNSGVIDGDVILDAGDDIYGIVAGSENNGLLAGGEGFDILALIRSEDGNNNIGDFSFIGFEALEIGVDDSFHFGGGEDIFSFVSIVDASEVVFDGAVFNQVAFNVDSGSSLTLGAELDALNALDFGNTVTLGSESSFVNDGRLLSSGFNSAVVDAENVRNVEITNNNLISATGDDSFGVYVFGAANVNLTNTAEATIGSLGDGGVGVLVEFSDSVNITNEGNILGGGEAFTGGVIAFGSSNVHITNEVTGLIGTVADFGTGVGIFQSIDSSITNEGRIATTGDSAFGIDLFDGIALEATNTGEIETSGFNSVAIGLGFVDNSIVLNSGDILTTGSEADGIRVGAFDNEFQPIFESNNNTISNDGDITVEGEFSAGVAVLVGSGNSVRNFGTISATHDNGFGILVNANDTTIENDTMGVISADGADGIGVFIDTAAGVQTSVFNSGTISGGLVAIGGGDGDETIVNSGTLSGSAVTLGGSDVFLNVGTVEGRVHLGDGNDSYVSVAGAVVTEDVVGGDGFDLLSFFASEDVTSVDLSLEQYSEFEALLLGVDGTLDFTGNTNDFGVITLSSDVTSSFANGAFDDLAIVIGSGASLDLAETFSAAYTSDVDALIEIVGSFASVSNAGTLIANGDDNDVIYGEGVSGVSITNSGTLEANGADGNGISLVDVSGVAIVNEAGGLIRTTGDASFAIEILDAEGVDIQNRGTIETFESAGHGVSVGFADVIQVTNDGSISTQGNTSFGVNLAFGEDVNFTNTENGTITTSGLESAGVRGTNLSDLIVTNAGDITTLNDRSWGITITRSDTIKVNNTATGTITTEGDDARGIYVFRSDNVTVSNAGMVSTSGDLSGGIVVSSGIEGVIENSGTVTTVGDDANGLWLLNAIDIDISNSGDIATTGDRSYGIRLGDIAEDGTVLDVFFVDVENSGTITTAGEGAHGIYLQLGLQDTITNSGTIDVSGAGAAGVWVEGTDQSVVNSADGTISVSGVDGIGVNFASTMGEVNSLVNHGIIMSADHAVIGGDGSEQVVNSGTIDGNILLGAGQDHLTLIAGATQTGQIDGGTDHDTLALVGAGDEPASFDLRNLENFEALSIETASTVMFADEGLSLTSIAIADEVETTLAGAFEASNSSDEEALVTLKNGASLTNHGGLTAEGVGAVSVWASLGNATITNAQGAHITASGDMGVAIQLGGEAEAANTVVNMGMIASTGRAIVGGDAADTVMNHGVIDGHIVLGGGDDKVVNAGEIDGNVLLGVGDDQFINLVGATVSGTVDGGEGDDFLDLRFSEDTDFDIAILDQFTGFERFAKSGAGVLNIAGDTVLGDFGVNEGLFAVNAVLTSNLTVAQNGTLGGNGTIVGDVVVSGVLNAGNSIDTLTIDGNLVLDADSIFEVEFNRTGADRVLVTGTADLQGGTLLLTPEGNDVFGVFSYEVLTAEGGITGDFGTQVAPNFALLTRRFEGNSLFLDIITQLGAGVTLDPQSEAVADYLNGRLVAGASASTLAVFTDLAQLNPTTQLNGALAQLHGEAYAASSSLTTTTTLSVVDALDVHGIGARQIEAGQYGLWATALSEFGDQDGQGGTSGFDSEAYGAMVGFDYGVANGVTLGALVGYQSVDQDFDALASDTEADNVFFGAYAAAKFGGLNVDASFVYHTADTETTRSLSALGLNARADYDVDAIVLRGRLGYDVSLGNGYVLEPYAGLAYIESDRDDIVETGAEGASLLVNGGTTDFTFLDLGARFTGQWGDKTRAHFNAAWRTDLSDDANNATARFVDESVGFTVAGAQIDDSRAIFGVGLNHQLTKRLSLYVDYDGEFASDLNSHALRGGLRFGF